MSGQEVLRAEAKMMRATLQGDVPTLEALIHPSFVFLGLHSAGVQAWTRVQWLDTLRQIKFHKLEHKARDVQVFPGSAVLTVEGSWLADLRGTKHDEHLLMTDVWVKTAPAVWRLVRRHSTRYVDEDGVARPGATLDVD